jgi:hypothetical protein
MELQVEEFVHLILQSMAIVHAVRFNANLIAKFKPELQPSKEVAFEM